jgi:hypothetical protein
MGASVALAQDQAINVSEKAIFLRIHGVAKNFINFVIVAGIVFGLQFSKPRHVVGHPAEGCKLYIGNTALGIGQFAAEGH